jgi:hypothetical protein
VQAFVPLRRGQPHQFIHAEQHVQHKKYQSRESAAERVQASIAGVHSSQVGRAELRDDHETQQHAESRM